VLVLEAEEVARLRGAPVRAEVLGYGASADAHHITQPPPDGRGAQRAIRAALAEAGVEPDAVQHVNAHGTSTGRATSPRRARCTPSSARMRAVSR